MSCTGALAGGTSLSKGFGLIHRFSEDIEVTVFRDDLGETHSVEDLQKLSGKKREAALDAIREACEAFINGPMLSNLTQIAAEASARNGIVEGQLKILQDKDKQTLLVQYPTATDPDAYIPKVVKIESAPNRHSIRTRFARFALILNRTHRVSPWRFRVSRSSMPNGPSGTRL